MLCKQLTSGIKRTLSILTLLCLIAVTVNAYTVVMRNGRRVDVGTRFVVTHSTLTYEVSPGFQVTLQMQAIDIDATERANQEQPGAFLRRSVSSFNNSASETTTPVVTGAVRTITNRDLAPAAERRRQSEVAYNKRLEQLGLPSLEESRYQAALEAEAIREELREIKGAEKQSESYWRSRASDLRTEMAVLDAEIQFVSARINEYTPENAGGALNSVTTVSPYFSLGNDRRYPRRNRGVFGDTYNNRGNVYSANPSDSRTGRQPYGRGRGRYDRNPYGRYGNGQIVIGGGVDVFPNIGTIQPTQSYDYSYERSLLITRYNELAAERVGFNARWRQLEQEARRAGVPPGWLRE